MLFKNEDIEALEEREDLFREMIESTLFLLLNLGGSLKEIMEVIGMIRSHVGI